jgi:WD40 repeat protein
VLAVAFTPDGQQLISAGADRTIKVRDVHSDQEPRTLGKPAQPIHALAVSPDGHRLAAAGALPQRSDEKPKGGELTVWDRNRGEEVWSRLVDEDRFFCVAFSPDGSRLATGGQGKVLRLWDAGTGDQSPEPVNLPGSLRGVAFSPDGRHLAAACHDEVIYLWDLTPGGGLTNRRELRGHALEVTGVAFGPDGRRLASCSWDRTVKLWDVATRQEALTLTPAPADAGPLSAVAFDGRRLAASQGTAGAQRVPGVVHLWEAWPVTDPAAGGAAP